MLNHLYNIIKDHFLRIRIALLYLNLWRCEDRADFFMFKDIILRNYYLNKSYKLKEKLDRLTTKQMEYRYYYPNKAKHNYIVVLNKKSVCLYFGYISKDMAYSASKSCLGVWRIKYKSN